MERTPLLPLPEGMLIDQIQVIESGLLIEVIATHPTACCPLCSEASSSIHSHYTLLVQEDTCS
jgi:transposase